MPSMAGAHVDRFFYRTDCSIHVRFDAYNVKNAFPPKNLCFLMVNFISSLAMGVIGLKKRSIYLFDNVGKLKGE